MNFEFDCPQFYDFENAKDDSHPEEYFETRQSHLDISPFPTTRVVSSLKSNVHTLNKYVASEEVYWNSRPAKNTRLSVKREEEEEEQEGGGQRMSERPRRAVSSCFQPTKEPAPKKVKLSPKDIRDFKQPLPVMKRERVKSRVSGTKAASRRWRSCAGPLTRTVPDPFTFSTDKRIKPQVQGQAEYKPLDFVSTLRSNTTVYNVAAAASGKVRPVPERLLRKRKVAEESKTMGEQLLTFQQELSTRHIPPPASPTDSKGGAKCPRITHPVTPHLRAKNRTRPLNVISQEEKENLEAEEMRKYHFKAQPMNRKILVPTGITAKPPMKPTKPMKVTLNTEKQATLRARTRSLDRPPEFHARPVPWKILQGVTGLGKKVEVTSTQPHSPAFALKKREEKWKQSQQEMEEAQAAAAREQEALEAAKFKVPRARMASQTVEEGSKEPTRTTTTTVPAPFSFHQRDQKAQAMKEQRVNLYFESQKPKDFKATPMPSPAVKGVPERKKISPTRVQGFSWELDQAARNRADKWQKQMEEQMKKQEVMIFKATPCTVTHSKPFRPQRTSKAPTEFANFNLRSETRAALRSKFEQELKEKEEQRQAQEEAKRLREEEEAQKELAEQRTRTIHKANPVPHYKTLDIKHGLIPSTKPLTPKFETDKRLKRKHE